MRWENSSRSWKTAKGKWWASSCHSSSSRIKSLWSNSMRTTARRTLNQIKVQILLYLQLVHLRIIHNSNLNRRHLRKMGILIQSTLRTWRSKNNLRKKLKGNNSLKMMLKSRELSHPSLLIQLSLFLMISITQMLSSLTPLPNSLMTWATAPTTLDKAS